MLKKATDSTSQKIFLAYLPFEVVAQNSDNSVRSSWKNHQQINEESSRWGDNFEKDGIGPAIALSQLYFDYDNGLSHARALIYTGLATQSLKMSLQRNRPGSENQRSYPSGHTSSAFATATVLSYSYGWKVAMVAYSLATFVGLSRLADDAHWFSDVVSGAFLGCWLGRASFFSADKASDEKSSSFAKKIFVFPSVQSQSVALNLHFEF